MDEPTVTVAASLLAIGFVFASLRYFTTPGHQYPPGPKRFPLIGCIHAFPRERRERGFAQWGKQYDSDIIYANVCGKPIVVLNTLEAARELLDKRSAIYSDRPRLVVLVEMLDFGGSVLLRYGDKFRAHRRATSQHFNQRASKQYEWLQEQQSARFLADLLQDPERFTEHAQRLFSSTILQIAYGHDVKSLDDEAVLLPQRAVQIGAELPTASASAVFIDFIPILKYAPSFFFGSSFNRQMAEGREIIRAMFNNPFEKVKSEMRSGTAPDSFTARLLAAHARSDGTVSAQDEDDIKRMAGHLHGAAADTSFVVTMTFILAMVLNPECFKKVQAEIDHVIGNDRLPSLNDKDHLPYLDCVIREVYRWNTPLPLTIPHASIKDDEYNGYFIPKGSTVIPNVWWMMRNPNIFAEPEKFRPERFMDDSSLPNPRDVIFGFGRRICPGRYLGESNSFMAISRLSACFDLSKAKDSDGNEIEPLVKFADGIISHPEHFKCTISPRSERAAGLIRKAQED